MSAVIPARKSWKQDLATYLEVDRRRSLGQIAGVVVPYLAVWVAAGLLRPGVWPAIGLGLVATVFLLRMYSFFHDLTHNAMFESRRANSRFGYLLGFFLFTPYRWWQRQHSLHHAHAGNLDERGPGEIYTMTVAEYRSASRARRIGYRLYRNPLLMLFLNYRLRAAHDEQPIFSRTPVVTVRSGLGALRLKLWDEERDCLVRFPA